MKKIVQLSTLAFLFNFTSTAFAQNETASLNTEAPAVTSAQKPMPITLKNAAEKSVAIFAGPKEEIKEPKITVVGGLSKNTLYLKENEAVCLMTPDKRPIACTIIKPGVTSVEVNVSANGISCK